LNLHYLLVLLLLVRVLACCWMLIRSQMLRLCYMWAMLEHQKRCSRMTHFLNQLCLVMNRCLLHGFGCCVMTHHHLPFPATLDLLVSDVLAGATGAVLVAPQSSCPTLHGHDWEEGMDWGVCRMFY